MTPQFSIITVVLNRRDMIGRAIESACQQDLEGVEHIVVDGGSTDGTLDILSKYPHLDISSGKDKNLYHAWNIGIRRAKGAFIVILNSDDELPPNALKVARDIIQENPEIDMISGSVELSRQLPGKNPSVRRIDDLEMLKLREQDIGPGIPLTNGRFMSRHLLDKVGPFDERYKVISDRQFLLRVLLHKPKNFVTQLPLYRYHIHDASLSLNDSGDTLEYSRQCLMAARDGVTEASSTSMRAAFCRWHAWATFYLSWRLLRSGSILQAFGTIVQSSKLDPLWPTRIPKMISRHLSEQASRRGRILP